MVYVVICIQTQHVLMPRTRIT